jgi:hypothetical protein
VSFEEILRRRMEPESPSPCGLRRSSRRPSPRWRSGRGLARAPQVSAHRQTISSLPRRCVSTAASALHTVFAVTNLLAEGKIDKISRAGVLSPGTAQGSSAEIAALRQGLQELGYVEGQNIRIEWQFAEGRRRFRSLKKTRETGDWRSSCRYGQRRRSSRGR